MKSILVDDEVWRLLQKHGQPFVDSPNDVMRKLLGLGGKSNETTTTISEVPVALSVIPAQPTGVEGKATPDFQYRMPILRCLEKMNGRGKVRDIIEAVGHEMRAQLTAKDNEILKSGPIKWENAAKWERQHMIMEGLLKKGSPHGIWEITEQGKRWLSQQR